MSLYTEDDLSKPRPVIRCPVCEGKCQVWIRSDSLEGQDGYYSCRTCNGYGLVKVELIPFRGIRPVKEEHM